MKLRFLKKTEKSLWGLKKPDHVKMGQKIVEILILEGHQISTIEFYKILKGTKLVIE